MNHVELREDLKSSWLLFLHLHVLQAFNFLTPRIPKSPKGIKEKKISTNKREEISRFHNPIYISYFDLGDHNSHEKNKNQSSLGSTTTNYSLDLKFPK